MIFRNVVKFVAQTDLDEILHLFHGRTIKSFLEDMLLGKTRMASVRFQSQRIRANDTWYFASHPKELNFDHFMVVDREDYVFPKPVYTKMIHMPDRVDF